jgi:hypothetical protein
MAVNLKVDLINQLGTKKFYAEIELGRLAGDPNMNYKEKIDLMECKLGEIALVNGEMALAQQYFPDPAPAAPDQVKTDPASVVKPTTLLPGQSHGE